ncbi:MAG: BON domain-containing protein, partial [Stenotrophobium sp.]
VNASNGAVTLTGRAPSEDAKETAENLAKEVAGVVSISNKIEAPSLAGKIETKTRFAANKTEHAVSDSWITTKVKSVLLADSVTKGFQISVRTRHHAVALSGTVDTPASAEHAAELAKQVEGVTSVDTSALKSGAAS